MKCPKCGLESDNNFCPNCGAKLNKKNINAEFYNSTYNTNLNTTSSKTSEKSSNTKKYNTKTIITFSLIFVAFIIIVFCVCDYCEKNNIFNDGVSITEETVSANEYDDTEYEEETEKETEKEKDINDYKKLTAKELCYNPNKYNHNYLRTTFKITKISENNYKYITYGIGNYDKVEISCPLDASETELSVGDNITVAGLCSLNISTYEGEYGESRKKLQIEITGGLWEISKNSNFKPFGKTKSKAYLSSFARLYSDRYVDIYYIDAEDDYGDVEARFLVNNKSYLKLTLQADTITFDGRSYNDIVMSEDVSAKSKGVITPTIYDCKNSNPKKVGFSFSYFDRIGNATIHKDITAFSQNVR